MSRKNVNLVFPEILGFERYIDVIFMGAAKINHRVYALLCAKARTRHKMPQQIGTHQPLNTYLINYLT
ncbi:hypothetical protein [Nostoc sp. FACHB-888]|uniref:hypothetical protein n=1 Tax=Nostoc sp. FACHB-888 TaxID=2692842 RepID=UPI00168A1BE5|nr:hypothetical protein [Nostoc sp. FACHB-888]MBD2248173.1 hypothetical protein [Nostoc sp. FACHB-888]